MNLSKKLYYTASSLLPAGLLRSVAPTTYLPYHHTVSDEPLDHIRHLYPYKNVKQFTADVDLLLKKLKPVSPADLYQSVLQKNRLPESSFLLTFDDGFREVHDIIAPILKAKGVPAIFFINPAFIDNRQLFYRCKTSLLIGEMIRTNDKKITDHIGNTLGVKNPAKERIIHTFKSSKIFMDDVLDNLAGVLGLSFSAYLEKQQPFLTTSQLTSLVTDGFTIGAHSWDHPYYPSLTVDQQFDQTVRSCNYVKEIIPGPLCFSFPYSDVELSQELFDKLKATDINLFFGIQNQEEELHNRMLHRFNAERPEVNFSAQLNGMMVYHAFNHFRNHKITRN